jgi:hypothetical protein
LTTILTYFSQLQELSLCGWGGRQNTDRQQVNEAFWRQVLKPSVKILELKEGIIRLPKAIKETPYQGQLRQLTLFNCKGQGDQALVDLFELVGRCLESLTILGSPNYYIREEISTSLPLDLPSLRSLTVGRYLCPSAFLARFDHILLERFHMARDLYAIDFAEFSAFLEVHAGHLKELVFGLKLSKDWETVLEPWAVQHGIKVGYADVPDIDSRRRRARAEGNRRSEEEEEESPSEADSM